MSGKHRERTDYGNVAEVCRRAASRVLRRDPHAAEDAAQEAVMKLWRCDRSRKRCRGLSVPVAQRYGFAVTCARRAAFDEARRRSTAWAPGALTEEPLAPEEPGEAERCEEASAAQAEARRRLDVALRALTRSERGVIRLRFVARVSDAWIARHYGISEGAARVRVCRAVAKMRAADRSGA
jgi:RNA polymerase sigma factor (sigma-70 family)